MRKEKTLITGGAGFIGSHLTNFLIANGYEIVIVDDLSTGLVSNINPKSTFYKTSIYDPDMESIFAFERINFVNHIAGPMRSSSELDDPLYFAKTTFLGSINLIRLAIKHKVKHFTYVSCAEEIYGIPAILPCKENHPVFPTNPEGIFKYTIELYLEMCFRNFGLSYTVLRYPTIYGPRQRPHVQNGLVALIIDKLLHNNTQIIPRDGDQRIDIVFIEDCIRAHLSILENGKCDGIYNLGSGVGTSINTILTALTEILKFRQNAFFVPGNETTFHSIYFDANKAQDDFGWVPKVDLFEGLVKTVASFKRREKFF